MSWWDEFQRPEVDRDFATIADSGFSEVRIFLLWEAFQPSPDTVAEPRLSDLAATLDCAERRGLKVTVTLFCGHMSGANWLPRWVLRPTAERGRFRIITDRRVMPDGQAAGDIYADSGLVAAQVYLATRLVREFGSHRALGSWDLGNEFSNVRVPARPDDAARWSALLTLVLSEQGTDVTGGLHSEDLEQDRRIRPSSVARPWRRVAMHGYPIYSSAASDAEDPFWVPFLCSTARALAGRPVIAQEIGLPDGGRDPGRVAAYASRVLELLWADGVAGASWWCYADYDGQLARRPPFDRAPHELRFGLTTAAGAPKPVLRAWQSFGDRPLRPPRLDTIDEEAYYSRLPLSLTEAYASFRAVRSERSNFSS